MMNIADLLSSVNGSSNASALLDVGTAKGALSGVENVQNFSEVLDETIQAISGNQENTEPVSAVSSVSSLLSSTNQTDYAAIAEELMNTSSGREVFLRLAENELASIVTDNEDNSNSEMLNNLLTAAGQSDVSNQLVDAINDVKSLLGTEESEK